MCKEMRGLNVLLLLFSCWIIAGMTAGDRMKKHYLLKNSSFCQQYEKSLKFVSLSFDQQFIIIDHEVTPNFTEKVIYNQSKKSFCINNLDETDSGTYEVSLRDTQYKKIKELHHLIVQENIPKPVIRMSVFSSNQSDAFCNITVNCSVWDEWVSSVCDQDGCPTSQESFNGFNITIYTENRAVFCIGKNHVSTNKVSEALEAKCFNESNPDHEGTPQQLTLPVMIIIIVVTVAAVCTILCALIVLVAKRHFSGRNHSQTSLVQAQIIQSQPAEEESQPVPRLSTSSSEAEASYENVDPTRPSATSSPTIIPRDELGSSQSQPVDTVYSFLEPPKVKDPVGKSDSSKDMKGHMTIKEASTSQTVTPYETQQPVQIDSVYSVLQKPEKVESQHHQ